ncbi:MAG: DUF1499 domain-containing protein [Methyloligella sp. ZOD6]
MTAPFPLKVSRAGIWGRRLALYFLLLMVLTAALHYFAPLGSKAAINLLALCFAGFAIALSFTAVALIRIWKGERRGSSDPVFAIIFAGIGVVPFLWFGAKAVQHPPLTDIVTTPSRPVLLKDLSRRPDDANPIEPPQKWAIAAQQQAYPDIQPLVLERSAAESFALVREAMRRLNWEIVAMEVPVQNSLGYIQAEAHTMFMGFTDDVGVEVVGDAATATIDVRSISRYGNHDFGANAARVAALFDEIREGIRKGEQPVLEAEPGVPIPTRKTPR